MTISNSYSYATVEDGQIVRVTITELPVKRPQFDHTSWLDVLSQIERRRTQTTPYEGVERRESSEDKK